MGNFVHNLHLWKTKVLSASGGSSPDQGLCPWSTLGALLPDPHYKLVLRACHESPLLWWSFRLWLALYNLLLCFVYTVHGFSNLSLFSRTWQIKWFIDWKQTFSAFFRLYNYDFDSYDLRNVSNFWMWIKSVSYSACTNQFQKSLVLSEFWLSRFFSHGGPNFQKGSKYYATTRRILHFAALNR